MYGVIVAVEATRQRVVKKGGWWSSKVIRTEKMKEERERYKT